MMSINAVKGVEIGAGMASAELTGEDNADEIRMGNDGKPLFLSNNAGGILGGISSGQPVVCRFAVKPTSSILTPRRTIDKFGKETDISTKGRHDPCVGIPRRAGRRGDDGAGAGRSLPAPPRADRVGSIDAMGAGGSVSQRLAEKAPYSYRTDRVCLRSRMIRRCWCSTACACCARRRRSSYSSAITPSASVHDRAVAARSGAVPSLRTRCTNLRDQPACCSRDGARQARYRHSCGTMLGGVWRALALLRVLPRPAGDWLYDRVAQTAIACSAARTPA
jgi:hypothetical protein